MKILGGKFLDKKGRLTYPDGRRRSGKCGGQQKKPAAERRGRGASATKGEGKVSMHPRSRNKRVRGPPMARHTDALRDWDIIAAGWSMRGKLG